MASWDVKEILRWLAVESGLGGKGAERGLDCELGGLNSE